MAEIESVTTLDISRLRASCAACALSQLCLPAGIDVDELSELERAVQQRRPLRRGQLLFDIGNAFHSLFVVRSGAFKTYSSTEQGELQILGFHLPGEIIGFDALAEDQHQCTAEALEQSSVCEVPFDALNEVSMRVPGLQRQLLRIASRELNMDHQHLSVMGRKQAQERLAIFLRSLSDRNRRLQLHHDDFVLPMSRQDIANYLGLVVETVSRLFTRFEEQGALKVERKRIRILKSDLLAELAGEVSTERAHEKRTG